MQIRLDRRWTEQLLKWPESGMGHQRVDVVMEDGRELKNTVVFNAEFLQVPDDFGEAIVAEIRLHPDPR